MDNGAFLVDMVNDKGEVVGQKRRIDIDKAKDIYHSVHVLMITPRGEVVLSIIPAHSKLPFLYPGLLGATTVTIRRTDENSDEAAVRTLGSDLFIDEPVELHWLGEKFHAFRDGTQTLLTLYYVVGDAPNKFSKDGSSGIITMSAKALRKEITHSPNKFAPAFLTAWETYADELPL